MPAGVGVCMRAKRKEDFSSMFCYSIYVCFISSFAALPMLHGAGRDHPSCCSMLHHCMK